MHLSREIYLNELVLTCPACQHGYTHHEMTTEYQRPGGEDDESIAVTVDSAGCHVHATTENPSARRHAVVLRFSGECGHEFDIEFVQHKGVTIVRAIPLEGATT